jgi:hypothetical protein
MPRAQLSCVKCGAEILAATAERTGGLCMPCKKGRLRLRLITLTAGEAEAELEVAARALETRARLLRVQTRRVSTEDWLRLTPHLEKFVPAWYRALLSRFSLYGLALEYRDLRENYVRVFSFAGPADYNATLEAGSYYSDLSKMGLVPIGYESNGNLWVVESPFSAASKVYMFDHSAWDGGVPGKDNGFVFAASRLSLLLCSMGFSEISYYESLTGVTSLIWREDREPINAS